MPGNKLCDRIMGENVVVKTTPVKIIAEILALIAVIWLAVSICGQEWVVVKFQHHDHTKYNWGIWKTCNRLAGKTSVCIKEGANALFITMVSQSGFYRVVNMREWVNRFPCEYSGWITVCFVFSILSVILSMVATVFGILSLTVIEMEAKRRTFFLIAGAFMTLVSVLELMVVIIYPVKFREDILSAGAVQRWDFDWTYGFAWGGMIFSVGSAILFFIPGKKRRPRTTYYSTR